MAVDEELAGRIRDLVGPLAGVTEQRMFGGLAFMLDGNMCVGVHGEDMIARLSAAEGERALAEPHVRMMDVTGRPMTGWLFVGPEATSTDEELADWVDRCVTYASSLPPKGAKGKRA
ncbi:MAG TPA: TfoX/Sxy family protein [Actinomycetota bacterium]|nr:TfoX/Sxy family protein [Actinomycetota bacterium]